MEPLRPMGLIMETRGLSMWTDLCHEEQGLPHRDRT
jgi:hypothetical protein